MAGVELLQAGCGLSYPAALALAEFSAVRQEGHSSGEVGVPRGQQAQTLPLCCTHLQQGHGLAFLPGSGAAADRSDFSRVPDPGCGCPGTPQMTREASG